MSGRRFGKSKHNSEGEPAAAYVPPTLDHNVAAPVASFPPPEYVTQPPKRQGLTGKISTLFRQKSNSTSFSHQSVRSGASSLPPAANIAEIAASSTSRPTTSKRHHHHHRNTSRSVDEESMSNASQGSRIFYSSHQDDDSDDSYESRRSLSARTTGTSTVATGTEVGAISHDDDDDDDDHHSGSTGGQQRRGRSGRRKNNDKIDTVVRYRGFSTSIQSLFLDESLVCAAMGCFGLILSNRTEHLLELRTDRRGLLASRSSGSSSTTSSYRSRDDRPGTRLPSRIVAYGLVLTVTLMFATFLVWGFGSRGQYTFTDVVGYDYYDDANGDKNKNRDDAWWDDYLQNKNNNKYNDDAAAAANNDDDAYNYNNYNYQNNYNNDDAAANDDANKGDDAAAANDDADDYYGANDDAARRRNRMRWLHTAAAAAAVNDESPETTVRIAAAVDHPLYGIFKLRDYQEHLWEPVVQMVVEEWNREQAKQNDEEKKRNRKYQQRNRSRRRAKESQTDDANNNDDNQDNSQKKSSSQRRSTAQHRDTGALIRMVLFIAFILFLGVLGRRRRMRTRFYIVRARAQEDHLYYASSDKAARRRVAFDNTREDQYEGACSHTLCGCYPVDEVEEKPGRGQQVEVTDYGIFRRKKKPHSEDFVARCFSCIMACCCGLLCKCWFQCLSVCALAQEAREIRLLLPPRYQRIDFITHQPFREYQKSVNSLRLGWLGRTKQMRGIVPHYNALSRLSRYIVVIFSLSVVAIVLTLIFNPRATFAWQDAVVLIATFLQSFLVLFIVHGIFHKSDLSLDAVIKMFAAGFLIAVPTAFFFEALLVNLSLFVSWAVYVICNLFVGDSFSTFVYNHWRVIWIIGELFNAYVVAAVTEELCKYYTFRTVEHPDLVFLTGLQREEQDEKAVDGGLVAYPFASHQVQDYIKAEDADHSVRSRSRSRSRQRSRSNQKVQDLLHGSRTDETSEFDDEEEDDVRTYRQKAMAITTGMISVAVGLACAENFLYVFVLGGALGGNSASQDRGGHILEAWMVLFFRSIFPIHALSAALQSINMIRKFVEYSDQNGHRIGVGRIIWPAAILHGSFDAVLMAINVYIETAWYSYNERHGNGDAVDGPPYNTVVVNIVAWTSISTIMFAGIVWYYRENRAQSFRLKLLEEREKELVQMTQEEEWTRKKRPPKSPVLSERDFV